MRDPRRIFTDAQKAELLAAAGYRCQSATCNSPDLSAGQPFEFHHDQRHADGGLTSIYNGKVLCVECHRQIASSHATADLPTHIRDMMRPWQTEAVSRFVDTFSEKTFVLEAAPGAGKTLFAACASRVAIDANCGISHVICIAPWKPIIRSMRSAFGLLRLQVRDKFHYDRKRGVLQQCPLGDVTVDSYQGFCSIQTVNVLKAWIERDGFRFMLIFDEIHHANAVSGKWGAYAEEIASLASKVVVMSGTYFRNDNRPISFLSYENDRPVRHYSIDYAECVSKRYVRQVTFKYHDPILDTAHIKSGWKAKLRQLSLMPTNDGKLLAKAKAHVLHSDGADVHDMISDAWSTLKAFRRKWPDAACLVVCKPGSGGSEDRMIHAVARKIQNMTGHKPHVVTSDDPESHGRLQAFADSTSPSGTDAFLCAVRMVSEGVDIPRIRVVLFLSYTDSEMLFRQIVGRALRYIKKQEDDTAAAVIMPAFPVMKGFAERFCDESRVGSLNMRAKTTCEVCGQSPCECVPRADRDASCETCGHCPCECYVILGTRSNNGGGQFADSSIEQRFIERASHIIESSSAHQHANAVQVADILQRNATMETSGVAIDLDADRELTLKNVKNLVAKIAAKAYRGDITEAWRVEVHDRCAVTSIEEVRSTWRLSQITKLQNDLRSSLLEAYKHG